MALVVLQITPVAEYLRDFLISLTLALPGNRSLASSGPITIAAHGARPRALWHLVERSGKPERARGPAGAP